MVLMKGMAILVHTGALRGAKAHCMLYITFQVLVGTYTYIKTQTTCCHKNTL